jgi:hypothetical protein
METFFVIVLIVALLVIAALALGVIGKLLAAQR